MIYIILLFLAIVFCGWFFYRYLTASQCCEIDINGNECVHLEDHPGPHRNKFGDYWPSKTRRVE
jgi:hypothetical protein